VGAPDPVDDTTADAPTPPADVLDPTDTAILAGPVPVVPPKPGWQTTEFWASLAPLVVFVIALFTHRQVDQGAVGAVLAGVGAIAVGGYAVYRQILKNTHVTAAASLHSDQLAAMPATLTIEPSDIDAIVGGVAAALTTGPVTVRKTPFQRPASKRPATSKRPAAKAAPAPRKKARR
jgi:hypothetical protein